jgi:hypothetical protein
MKRIKFNITGIFIALLLISTACSHEKKDWNKTKQLMSVQAFENFIKIHPESSYLDSANYYVEKLSYRACSMTNTVLAYEDFLEKYPDSPYKASIQAQLENKRVCREMAMKIFTQAQQATGKYEKRRLYYKTDSLFYKANFTEFMCDAFQYPTRNLHFETQKNLEEKVDREFTTIRYIYGKPVTDYFTYDLKNEKIGKIISYKIFLASTGNTKMRIALQLLRNGRVVDKLGENNLTLHSDYYSSYLGFIRCDSARVQPNDKLRVVLTASGDNFGIMGGNYKSFIKGIGPMDQPDSIMLAERKKAISWTVMNSKWAHPGDLIFNFTAQLDYCILHGKNARWNFGWGSQRDDNAYQVRWQNNHFTLQKLTLEEAGMLGIKENTTDFKVD